MNTTFTPLSSVPFESMGSHVAARPALVCFSHLRWNFVHQRPQHLLNAAAATYQVYFLEEPELMPGEAFLKLRIAESGVVVLTPVIDPEANVLAEMRRLTEGLHRSLEGRRLVHWYYTPMALKFTRQLAADLCVYDCMDDLSAFRFAPPELRALETELMRRADLVFTGGQSLYEAKRQLHPDVHCFPSSVDVTHFGRARTTLPDPVDQAAIAGPRIGFAGVIDERIDLELIASAARGLPDVQFVMLGPLAKLGAGDLPHAPNLNWLGQKNYKDLPAYMAHWQAAWMPFALNEATRFISPTKTPEYLAAGLRVTSTAIADVVKGYGTTGLVAIADDATIVDKLRASLAVPPEGWRDDVDRCLDRMSWASTWAEMQSLVAARQHALQEA